MEEVKRENNDTLSIDVYKIDNKPYIYSEICNNFNIGNNSNKKLILNKNCYEVSQEDINKLEKEKDIKLYFKKVYNSKTILSFTIYVDNNEELYISDRICQKYNIDTINKKYIDNSLYCLVTEEDINTIEKEARKNNILLQKKHLILNNNSLDNNTFTYYYNLEDKKLYISRDLLEQTRNKEIEIEGTPKIINNKNCYSITEEQLNNIETIINKKGIEKIIKTDNNKRIENDTMNKKGEDNMNPENNIDIEAVKEELYTIANQEELIMEMLKDNHEKMEKVKERIKNISLQEENDSPTNVNSIKNEQQNHVKILGDSNVDIDKIKEELNNIIKKDAESYTEKELRNIKIDVEKLKEELANYIDDEEPSSVVKIIGDPNVNIEDIKRQINNIGKENTNIVKILGDPNVDINDIKRQLNEITEKKVNHNIVKILGDQNVDIDKVKEDLNKILNNEKEQNLVKLLGDPNIDIDQVENEIDEVIEDETNKNIIKNVSQYNVDLNAVRDELLNKERLSPTERITVNTPENNQLLEMIKQQTMNLREATKNIDTIPINNIFNTVTFYIDEDNKTFAPKEYADNNTEKRYINGMEYNEVSEDLPNNIRNKQVIVKKITDEEVIVPNTIKVIVCNANDKLFVSQEILNSLEMYVVDPHKIIVNKEIYVEINKDDLEMIRSKESPSTHIIIDIKHITPVKG